MTESSEEVKNKELASETVKYVRDFILEHYQPAGEFDFDFHLSSRQLLESLSQHISLIGFCETDLVKVLTAEGFVCIEITAPFEFYWIFKRK